MKKVVIFDMDGVLFDTGAIATEYMFQQFPMMTGEQQMELLSGNFHEEIQKFKATLSEPHVETPEEKEIRQAAYAAKKLQSNMYDGIFELLQSLESKEYTMVVNTSALNRNSLPLFERTNTTHFFDLIATAEVSMSKVEKFSIIAEKYQEHTTDVLFVTDTLGDIKEAAVAGVPTVAVTWGAHDRSFFTREHFPTLIGIVDTVAELETFISDYFASTQ